MAPIARREMLVLARSPTFYRARITASIFLLVVGAGFAVIYHYFGVMPATQMLAAVSFPLLMFCLFVGVQLTADSIAREKREGTLGLLLLTPQTPLQIVVGKLLANGLVGFYALLIAFPLISLVLISGGLLFRDILLVGVVALNILFVSGSAGLVGSALRTDRKKAANMGTNIVLFLWWGLPALAMLTRYLKGPDWIAAGFQLFAVTPFAAGPFVAAPQIVPRFGTLNLICTHLLGWGLLALACFYLRRHWQEIPPRTKMSLREGWKQLSYGRGPVRARFRQEVLPQNPFFWLAARDRLRGAGVWVLTVIVLGVLAWFYARRPQEIGLLVSLSIGLSVVHKAIACSASGSQIAAEQDQGTIEMLVSTPLSTQEIVQGQLKATARQFRGPVVLVLLLHLLTTSAILLVSWNALELRILGALAFLGYSAMYFFDMYTAAWLGMWGVVISRDPKHAFGAALGRLMIFPAFVFAAGMLVFRTVEVFLQVNWKPAPGLVLAIWIGLGLVNNVYWLRRVRRLLPSELRTFSLRRYTPEEREGMMVKLGRMAGSFARRHRFAAKRFDSNAKN